MAHPTAEDSGGLGTWHIIAIQHIPHHGIAHLADAAHQELGVMGQLDPLLNWRSNFTAEGMQHRAVGGLHALGLLLATPMQSPLLPDFKQHLTGQCLMDNCVCDAQTERER